jgi:hypothetical protein
VVKESGGAKYPTLTRSNYTHWSLVMKVMLQARNLWDAIEYGDCDLQEDCMAREVLSVPPEMVSQVAKKQSAADAWDAIKTMCVGSDKVQKGRAQQLRREFETMICRSGEKVDDFALRLSNLVINLEELGEEMEEQRVVEKLLRSMPPRFDHLVMSIETLLDISSLSLEEVTRHLKAQEDRMDRADSNRDSGKLLYADAS